MFDIDLTPLLDALGERETTALAGAIIGVLFGVCAQRSRFCLRAAVVEFASGAIGQRTALWLLAFSTAVFWVQAGLAADALNLDEARWRTAVGSMSGAILGGLLFGVGMVLARGCPGRLLVLAASGNLRSLLSGLVFAVVAQITLQGALAPSRDALAGLWTTSGPNPDVLAELGVWRGGMVAALAAVVTALVVARNAQVSARVLWFGSGVGFAVACGWWITGQLADQTFDPTPIESLTFSGPSANALMFLLEPVGVVDFNIGLMPGVVIGAAVAAWIFGEWRWEGWSDPAQMRRSLIGAAAMGYGAMLAGGCAIGAGVTGASTFALTAWVALTAFWIGGAISHRIVDAPGWRSHGADGSAEPVSAAHSSARSVSRTALRSLSTGE